MSLATVIVIAYNEEQRITACLEALLAQDTDIEYEVVVVDDGSSDSTSEVVESLMEHAPNLRLLRHEVNRGRGAARRSGQDSARSLFVGFVDADIVVPPNWLTRCLAELEVADGVSGVALPDGDCAVTWRIAKPSLRVRKGSAELTGNNVMFKAAVLERAPYGAESRLGEDFRQVKTMVRLGLLAETLSDLVVEHRETKSYPKAFLWMWQSGRDATALWREFRVTRLPDLAWLWWVLAVGAALGSCVSGVVGVGAALLWALAATLVVDALFTYSRFRLFPNPQRWLVALVLGLPLIAAYLAGRTAGLVRQIRQL